MPVMLLASAYCNAFTACHWAVRQKLNHVSLVQWSSAQFIMLLCMRFNVVCWLPACGCSEDRTDRSSPGRG